MSHEAIDFIHDTASSGDRVRIRFRHFVLRARGYESVGDTYRRDPTPTTTEEPILNDGYEAGPEDNDAPAGGFENVQLYGICNTSDEGNITPPSSDAPPQPATPNPPASRQPLPRFFRLRQQTARLRSDFSQHFKFRRNN